MKSILNCFIIAIVSILNLSANEVNYSEHISPIIYKNCTGCHRPNEIGPMPFTKYSEVKAFGNMIKYVTSDKSMPPWKADNNFNKYVGQRGLTQEEINLIKTWVDNGMVQGDPNKEAPKPEFPDGSQLGKPDLTISMAKSHIQKGTNKDDYIIFVLPTNLTEDKEISAIEFRPGNKRVVHHVLIAVDSTGRAREEDAKSIDYGYRSLGFGVSGVKPFVGYVPGAAPTSYPEGIGFKLPKGSDLLLQMHYGPTPIDEADSSHVNIYFAKKPLERLMYDKVILPTNLVNGPFVIPANKVVTFQAEFRIPFDITMFGIAPHSHLLSKSWKAVAVNPNGDTINLIKIDNWDFNWQGAYNFEKPVVLKRNSKIISWGTYDNTVDNPNNPSSPPQESRWGEKTTDEMYYLPVYYSVYKKGDENLIITNVENKLVPELATELQLLQNPTNSMCSFNLDIKNPTKAILYDNLGRIVNQIELLPNQSLHSFDVSNLSNGQYQLILKENGKTAFANLVIQK